MATLLRTGALVVSVDLPTTGSVSNSGRRPLSSLEPLAELLTELQISATWGVPSPSDWNAAEPLLQLATPQELAILADSTWNAAFRGRDRFVRGLALHQEAAAKIGYRPTTFAFRDGNLNSHVDLAQKQGITATRPAAETVAETRGFARLFERFVRRADEACRAYRPQTARFGLWDLKPSASWPERSLGHTPRLSVAAWRRGIEEAIALRGVFHLALDGEAIARAGSRAIRGLRKLLAHAVRRREQTRLAILSMRQIAAQLSSPRAGTTARSILHARAA